MAVTDSLRNMFSNRVSAGQLDRIDAEYRYVLNTAVGPEVRPAPPTTAFYRDILAAQREVGNPGLAGVCWDILPSAFAARPTFALKQFADGTLAHADLQQGEKSLYWNGDSLEIVAIDLALNFYGDFCALTERILAAVSATTTPVTVVDFGAGTGALGFYLLEAAAARGVKNLRVVNIDKEPLALTFGRLLCTQLNLQDRMNWILADTDVLLEMPNLLADLRSAILGNETPETGTMLVTRGALFPHYSAAQCRVIFDFFLGQVGAERGWHLEMTGYRTAAGQALLAKIPVPIRLPPKFLANPSEPLGDLVGDAARRRITVTERIEIWPHFINGYFPSYLAWERGA